MYSVYDNGKAYNPHGPHIMEPGEAGVRPGATRSMQNLNLKQT